jgi:predicted component of type VI protein secretion system
VALNDGPSILVDKPILLLGRHPECDIQIDSRKISRRHCCIAQVNDYLVVRDLDSTNGIRINGVRVVEGKLHHGDELTIGNHRYKVTWGDEPPVLPGVVRPARAAPAVIAQQDSEGAQDADALSDDLLESCDEPVALPEPPVAARPVSPPRGVARPLPPRPSDNKDEDSVILPDNLELIPNSGSFPGLSGPAAESHSK